MRLAVRLSVRIRIRNGKKGKLSNLFKFVCNESARPIRCAVRWKKSVAAILFQTKEPVNRSRLARNFPRSIVLNYFISLFLSFCCLSPIQSNLQKRQPPPPLTPQENPTSSTPATSPAPLDSATIRPSTASASNEKTPELFRYKLPKKENMFILPLVYHPNYNIYFYKLETLHPFDCHKYEKIAGFLMDFFKKSQLDLVLISPRRPVTNEELQLVHSKEFIRQITRNKFAIIKATEAPVMTCIPMCLIRKKLIKAFKTQVAGSILTAYLSLKYKICINLGKMGSQI